MRQARTGQGDRPDDSGMRHVGRGAWRRRTPGPGNGHPARPVRAHCPVRVRDESETSRPPRRPGQSSGSQRQTASPANRDLHGGWRQRRIELRFGQQRRLRHEARLFPPVGLRGMDQERMA